MDWDLREVLPVRFRAPRWSGPPGQAQVRQPPATRIGRSFAIDKGHQQVPACARCGSTDPRCAKLREALHDAARLDAPIRAIPSVIARSSSLNGRIANSPPSTVCVDLRGKLRML